MSSQILSYSKYTFRNINFLSQNPFSVKIKFNSHRYPYLLYILTRIHICCIFSPVSIFVVYSHPYPYFLYILTCIHICFIFSPVSIYSHPYPYLLYILTCIHICCIFSPVSIFVVYYHMYPYFLYSTQLSELFSKKA